MSNNKWLEGYNVGLNGGSLYGTGIFEDYDSREGWEAGFDDRCRQKKERERNEECEIQRQKQICKEQELQKSKNSEDEDGDNEEDFHDCYHNENLKHNNTPSSVGFKIEYFIEDKLGPKFGLSDNQKRIITKNLKSYYLGDVGAKEVRFKIITQLGINLKIAKKIIENISWGLMDIRN